MAFRFDGAGSLRFQSNRDSDELGVYGICERHTALASGQTVACINTGPESAYITTSPGTIPGNDGQIHALRYADLDAALSTMLSWSAAGDFATPADGSLYSFAMIPYLDGATPRVKFAIRPYPTGTLVTATRVSGYGFMDWTKAKIQIGAQAGNSDPIRARISKIAIRNVSEPSDAQINAYFDSHHMSGADILTAVSGIGKANLAAALVDESGNGNNWTSSGSGITLDDSNNPTANPTISGIMVMPSEGTVGGGTPTAPAAPSQLAATALNSDTVQLVWTDNSDNEVEFIAQARAFVGGSWSAWSDVQSVAFDATQMGIGSLTPGTGYEFRVRAVNAGGESAHSNTAAATTKRLYVKVFVESAAAGQSGISIAMWRTPASGDITGAAIPVDDDSGLQFNALTEVDPTDSVTKAVLEINMTQPPPLPEQTHVPMRHGDTVMVVITRPASGKWTQIIPDAKVVEV